MSDTIGAVKLEHFRGLPNSKFDLSGKNFVILGSNGKGKSGLVDGIEFLFSGQVGRFVGTGTGSINHDDAVQHIQHGGVPTVSVSLTPSKAAISRKLGTDDATFCARPNGKTYLEQHPGVSSFILRRAKILEFINDHASDRYKKFVQLLGITELDALQGAFVTAEKEGSAAEKFAIDAYKLKLAAFDDVDSKFTPKKLDDILLKISTLIAEIGLENGPRERSGRNLSGGGSGRDCRGIRAGCRRNGPADETAARNSQARGQPGRGEGEVAAARRRH